MTMADTAAQLQRKRDLSDRRADFFKNGLIQALLIMNAFIMLYPLFVMVLSAFKTNAEIFSSPFSLPQSLNFDNLTKVWTQTNFVQYLANSVGITAVSVEPVRSYSSRMRLRMKTS